MATDEVKCIDDEVPFDLPMGWEWRRLGSLSFDSADGPFGSNLKREHYTSNREVRIIQLSNIGEFGWKDSNVRYTTFAHLTTISRSEAFAGDIIIAKMMPAGRAIICPTLESKYVLSSDAVRFSFSTELEKTYLYYAINSPVFLEQVYGEVQGLTRVRTSLQKLRSYLLPIPPINEQKKIVKIIDQLLTLTFNYEKAQDAINELNDHVKPLLKRSILQEAIQGRLVEQCETDEPASVLLEQIRAEKEKRVKAGLLKKSALQDAVIFKGDDNKYWEKRGKEIVCIDDEIPFDIPDSWTWCRIKDIFLINSKNNAQDDIDAAFIPMEKIDATYLSSFTYSTKKWGEIKKGFTHFADGDVAFAKITPCFQNRKSMILRDLPNGIGAGTTELKVLRSYGTTIINEYLLFFLESSYFVDEATFKGTANQQRIISGYLENKLFPLPPLQEQQRIVDAVLSTWQVL